jgi:hypothetical protein
MDLVVLGDFLERLRKRPKTTPQKPATATATATATAESWKDVGADPEEGPTGLDASMSTQRNKSSREYFTESRALSAPMTTRRIVYRVVGLIIAVIAAYLAWNCDEGKKSMLYRIGTTVLAFFFGLIYIVLYIFFHSEVCLKKK